MVLVNFSLKDVVLYFDRNLLEIVILPTGEKFFNCLLHLKITLYIPFGSLFIKLHHYLFGFSSMCTCFAQCDAMCKRVFVMSVHNCNFPAKEVLEILSN